MIYYTMKNRKIASKICLCRPFFVTLRTFRDLGESSEIKLKKYTHEKTSTNLRSTLCYDHRFRSEDLC